MSSKAELREEINRWRANAESWQAIAEENKRAAIVLEEQICQLTNLLWRLPADVAMDVL